MHNPHVVHKNLDKGVHGSLKGFVVDSSRGKGKVKVKTAAAEKNNKQKYQSEIKLDTENVGEPNNAAMERKDVISSIKSVVDNSKTKEQRNEEINAATPSLSSTASNKSSSITTSASRNKVSNKEETNNPNNHKIINLSDSIHPVAHLSCTDHGGPSDPKIIDEMVFWSDIPSDASYVSPMYEEGQERYLTFEPDHGGWNNIRMAMETALVMSHAMGRILVLPPEQGMYLLHKSDAGQKTTFSFNDFFHLDAIAVEHKGFKVITTEEFLKREAITGGLTDKSSHEVIFPPENRTDWNGRPEEPLFKYLREVANTPEWDPWECALAIPSTKEQKSIDELNTTLHSIMDGSYGKPRPALEEFNGNPTPVSAPLGDRMREMLADRNNLCIYDKPLQEEKVIHLKVQGGVRLLTHFYAFIFFADWRQDLWSKRKTLLTMHRLF
jgi:hypothetical protein